MKRLIVIVLALIMVLSMQITAQATGLDMTFSGGAVVPGKIVYLKVALTPQVRGNSVAITITTDNTVLTWLPESSTWARQGVLQDFGMIGNAGVWTTEQMRNLEGELCTLAFRVENTADLSDAKVQCTVVVKNGAERVGLYTGEAILNAGCAHEYGDWENLSAMGHNRICKICDAHQTQPHSWDDGVITQDPQSPNMSIMTYTCTDCGAVKTRQMDSAPPQTNLSEPGQDHTHPTQGGRPVTLPTISTHPHDHSTTPTGQQGKDDQDNGSMLLGVIVFVGALVITGSAIAYIIMRDKKTGKGSEKK